MIYALKYKVITEDSLERFEAEGSTIPPELSIPELADGLNYYFNAFCELSTCRSYGMAEGPISVNAILEYCGYFHLDEFEVDKMIFYVMKMDQEYLHHRNKELTHAQKKNKK